MSRGNFLMNTVAGKLGSMVFYRAGGEQRTRAYVASVNDAKTRAQVTQRTQLSNLVAMYRVAQVALNKAFTNRPSNQSDYNAFVSANLNKVKIYIPKPMAAAKGCVVAPYQISGGALPTIAINGAGVDAVTNIALGSGFTLDATTTVAQLSAAILNNNSGLVEGMQLSYVSIVQSQNVQTGYPACAAHLFELVLSLSNDELAFDYIPSYGLANKSGFLGHGAFVASGGFCWIWSAKDALGKLQVSTQNLIVTSADLYTSYTTEEAQGAATRSYSAQAETFLDPLSTRTGSGVAYTTVSSIKIGSTVLTEGAQPLDIAAGAAILINGTNLVPADVSILFSTAQSRLSDVDVIAQAAGLATLVTIGASSDTAINGTIAGATSTCRQVAIVIGGVVMYHVFMNAEAEDPNA